MTEYYFASAHIHYKSLDERDEFKTDAIEGFMPARSQLHNWLCERNLDATRLFEMDNGVDYGITDCCGQVVGTASVLKVERWSALHPDYTPDREA